MRRLIDLGDQVGVKVTTVRTGRKLWDAERVAIRVGDLDAVMSKIF